MAPGYASGWGMQSDLQIICRDDSRGPDWVGVGAELDCALKRAIRLWAAGPDRACCLDLGDVQGLGGTYGYRS